MRAVIQRSLSAEVEIEGKTVGRIGRGFLILLGVESSDGERHADAMAAKISGLRVFKDSGGKMNLSLADIGGEVLVISNFTLCADCSHGRRPNFMSAAAPDTARPLYDRFCERLTALGVRSVKKGVFGSDMRVSLINDGPVTIVIDSEELKIK